MAYLLLPTVIYNAASLADKEKSKDLFFPQLARIRHWFLSGFVAASFLIETREKSMDFTQSKVN
jgi:hypothetical protein